MKPQFTIPGLTTDVIDLLGRLIAIPSFSKEEAGTAALLDDFLLGKNISARRKGNNVWCQNGRYDPEKPTLLLNSHHDTVRPNPGYTNDPFVPLLKDGRLYGLGSNDAGASLVCLLTAFIYLYDRADLPFNLIFAATAEEEISGANGIEALLKELPSITCAIVGEPTGMQMAIAEKGLLVLDCTATGIAGHAAREEGENAIYKALPDIEWFQHFCFPEVSPLLGPVKMSVTMIAAGTQHNMVPDSCRFSVDVRLNDCYTHEEILTLVREHVQCQVFPRSMRLKSTSISEQHPLVQAGLSLHLSAFGSSTMSDKALMPFPALKIGPGNSARSHAADEYILLREIEEGIITYIRLLETLKSLTP